MNPLLAQFAPDIAKKLEGAERAQIAFSEALTPEQQTALPPIIGRGPESFIAWSRTEAGRAAIRDVVEKFLEASK